MPVDHGKHPGRVGSEDRERKDDPSEHAVVSSPCDVVQRHVEVPKVRWERSGDATGDRSAEVGQPPEVCGLGDPFDGGIAAVHPGWKGGGGLDHLSYRTLG